MDEFIDLIPHRNTIQAGFLDQDDERYRINSFVQLYSNQATYFIIQHKRLKQAKANECKAGDVDVLNKKELSFATKPVNQKETANTSNNSISSG